MSLWSCHLIVWRVLGCGSPGRGWGRGLALPDCSGLKMQMELFSRWWALSCPCILLYLLLPTVSLSCAVPCTQRKAQTPPLPLILPVHPSLDPTSHTLASFSLSSWYLRTIRHCLIYCLSPGREGPYLFLHYCISWA